MANSTGGAGDCRNLRLPVILYQYRTGPLSRFNDFADSANRTVLRLAARRSRVPTPIICENLRSLWKKFLFLVNTILGIEAAIGVIFGACRRRMKRKVSTVKGVPAFQLAPLEEDDDLIDRLLEHNPKFQNTLENCLRSRSLTSAEALRRLK